MYWKSYTHNDPNKHTHRQTDTHSQSYGYTNTSHDCQDSRLAVQGCGGQCYQIGPDFQPNLATLRPALLLALPASSCLISNGRRTPVYPLGCTPPPTCLHHLLCLYLIQPWGPWQQQQQRVNKIQKLPLAL